MESYVCVLHNNIATVDYYCQIFRFHPGMGMESYVCFT